jgi:hypothetical protein
MISVLEAAAECIVRKPFGSQPVFTRCAPVDPVQGPKAVCFRWRPTAGSPEHKSVSVGGELGIAAVAASATGPGANAEAAFLKLY